ncbi:MAG: FtsW/RodA/SpoVE family cell cycle protein [Pseudomonadota bacterium]
MTTSASSTSFVRLAALGAAARALCMLAALALFVAGWIFIAGQQTELWERLPADTTERFVADRIAAPLPALPGAEQLQSACARTLSWQTQWRRAWLRAELADCLAAPDGLTTDSHAQGAIVRYQDRIEQQVAAANAWLTEYDAKAPRERAALEAQLKRLQSSDAGPLAPLAAQAARLASSPTSVRETLGRPALPDQAARTLRAQIVATEARVAAISKSALAPGEQARALALLATGLQLVTDYGSAPPQVHLTTDRDTLADALEWQRRARAYDERGFQLSRLQVLPAAIFASACLLVIVAAWCARSATAVALWALATHLLALGALMLTDVALTGDPALRYLAERQFANFGLGERWLPLVLDVPLPAWAGGGTLAFWWPLALVAAALLALRCLRDGRGMLLAPLRAWVRAGASVGSGAAQSALLLAAGVACVLFLGMPAAVSELLILLGCVGVASYLARQAPLANAGAGLQAYNVMLVAAALALAVGGALARGDLGHALVALLLAACFAWLFGWAWLRMVVLACVAIGAAALAACLAAGKLVGPLAVLVPHLPQHAQERFYAMFDPFRAASSDLARVHWLIDSAGASGWGLGYAPWRGLAGAGVQDGLPLQGPSDYVLALTATLWGQNGGVLLMGLVLLVFGAGAGAGLRTALRAAMPPAARWLAAVGAFGCIMMAAKALLSLGGVSGVLPLTGLPVGLLGYGPVTHLAALLYLTLALGTLHINPQMPARGVHVHAPRTPVGAARRRGAALALAAVAALGVLLALASAQLRAGAGAAGAHHLAQSRLDMANAIGGALVPASADVPDYAQTRKLPCPELEPALAAWNRRLATLPNSVRMAEPGSKRMATLSALRLDPARLLAAAPVADARACRNFARTLGQMLVTDLARLVGRQDAAGKVSADAARLAPFHQARMLGARPLDYSTANAWWGRPGCILPAAALGAPARNGANAPACPAQSADGAFAQLASDLWLQRELAPQLHLAVRQPAGAAQLNHHAVATGPTLGLTLEPALQAGAQRIADCFTGRAAAGDCDSALPQDGAWRARYLGAKALRAGALGIVLAEVDSGRVVALAGAVSDCTLGALASTAQTDEHGRMPALLGASACAQLPDRRSVWLAQQHPALWMLPPGSALKEFSLVAGIDAGVVARTNDAYWKRILAESHEREPIQRTALAAGQRYLDVLSHVGFGQGASDLLWGGPAGAAPFGAQWRGERYAGTAGLRASSMSLAQAEQIRTQKQAGVNVDKTYGTQVMGEFLAARRLADAAVGGGDIRVNAVGLVDAWRQLDLRARGKDSIDALHLLEQSGRAPATRSLAWASPQAAARALGMTEGVSSSAWNGTAQGACRVVFGACPAQGIALAGKTGSSDFLTAEDGPYVKPGMQLPAKLFGGVFAAPGGKRYAVAVMALRVREGDSRTLDLKSSAAAEAAMLMMRQLGLRAQTGL